MDNMSTGQDPPVILGYCIYHYSLNIDLSFELIFSKLGMGGGEVRETFNEVFTNSC